MNTPEIRADKDPGMISFIVPTKASIYWFFLDLNTQVVRILHQGAGTPPRGLVVRRISRAVFTKFFTHVYSPEKVIGMPSLTRSAANS